VLSREHFEINPEEIHVNFSDVKGVDEAKQELKDIVEFLKDPEKFTALGAKLPKGKAPYVSVLPSSCKVKCLLAFSVIINIHMSQKGSVEGQFWRSQG
jgi:hypothetical protein